MAVRKSSVATRRKLAGAALRQEDVTAAIERAVFAELAQKGYGKLSIEGVARRAGAGKTTVYRRWKTKDAMVVELVSRAAVSAITAVDTGTLAGDLVAFLSSARDALQHPLVRAIVPDILAEATRNEPLATALFATIREPRRAEAAKIFLRAQARGELPRDIDLDLALDFLGGPLYWRLAIVHRPMRRDHVTRLARMIAAAAAAAGAARAEPRAR